MHAQDCYLKYIDKTGEHPVTVSEHRVWDKDLFVHTRAEYFANHKNEDERRTVVEINKYEFASRK